MSPSPADLVLAGLVSQLAEREPRFGYRDAADLHLELEDAITVLRTEPTLLADALADVDTATLAVEVLSRPVTAAADTLLGVVLRNALVRQAATFLLPTVQARIDAIDEERQQAFERRRYGRLLTPSERTTQGVF